MRKIVYYFIFLMLYGCGKTTVLENAAFPNFSNKQVSLSIDSFHIPNAIYDSISFNFLQGKEIKDSLYLFTMNGQTKKFEIYNLENLTQVWELNYLNLLDSFHSNQKVWSVYFHNLDTVVLHSEYSISLVNRKKLIYQQIINEPDALENPPYSIASQQITTTWDSEKLGFWAQGYCSVCTQKAGDKYFKTSIEVFIPADSSRKWDTLPITYPKRYYEKEQGFNTNVFRTIIDRKHIYSFAAEPDLYILDLETKKVSVLPARSQSDTSNSVSLSKKDAQNADIKLSKLANAIQYQQLIYDKYRNLYYRIFAPALPEKDAEGLYNSFTDKRHILMVFDQNFNLIGEYLLPKQKFAHYAAFVGKKGLYFPHLAKPYTVNYEQKFSIYSFY